MAEYANTQQQELGVNATVVFDETPVPCNRGLIRHRNGSGVFNLSGAISNDNRCALCGCSKNKSANYLVQFSANIAVPSTGTAGPISLAFIIGGTILPSSQMIVTPTVTEGFFNVSRSMNIQVWNGCCENFGIINTSNQNILISNANIVITRPDLNVTI